MPVSGSTPRFSLEESRIRDLQADLLARRLSCRELVAAYLERIERLDRAGPRLNSIVSVNEAALDQARRLDERLGADGVLSGPLHGIPLLVKDQADTEDMPTSYGLGIFAAYRPASDATLVRRLRQAGALILAKTTMPDFATSYFSFSSRSGVTRNPYRLDCDPGGSSSGTGAAVAANLGAAGVGEDTGGSIRVPGSFNALVGLRPTTGLVPRTGLSPLTALDDTPGPMARTVEDATRLFDVLRGYDESDPQTAVCALAYPDVPPPTVPGGIRGRRLGVVRSLFGAHPTSDAVNQVIDAELVSLEAAGATLVDPVEIEGLDEVLAQSGLVDICARGDLETFLATLPRTVRTTLEEIYTERRYDPRLDLFDVIMKGPRDYRFDVRFLQGFAGRDGLRRAVLGVMARHDLDALAYPSVQVTPPTHDELAAGTWTTMTFPTNSMLAPPGGFPAITIPAGFAPDGSPVGLELLGHPYADRTLLAVARDVEAVGSHRRAPDLRAADAA